MKKIFLLIVVLVSFTEAKSMFLQDPSRTPNNPKQVDPVTTVDGSTGKYKKDHKTSTGKHFATDKKHIKTAKARYDNGLEKEKTKDTEPGK
jgi:hypothetical protein